MLLQCQNITKAFGDKTILKNVSFFMEEREKAAIVGINGAGKSTLLRIITGSMPPDDGLITLRKDLTPGYLAQHDAVKGDNTIFEEVMTAKEDVRQLETSIKELEKQIDSARGSDLDELVARLDSQRSAFEHKNGYALMSEVTGVLSGLGFSKDDYERHISELSGGEKTRVALSKLLLTSPELLILDEPTNHLDIDSIVWLEGYIKNYPGAVLIVAHDRYFLDRTVNKVIELENSECTVFSGNYSAYAEKKRHLREEKLRLYMKQQAEIAHQEAVIDKLRSFNREKSIKRAESREKQLAKMDRIEKPLELHDSMKLKIEPSIESGKDVLMVSGLGKSYGDRTLFKDLEFTIRRGERVALTGRNGAGKTTILRILNDTLEADEGRITLGAKVHVGYYDQEQQLLNMKGTLFDQLHDAYPYLDNTKIRNTLAAFLFTGDDVFKLAGDLSGGERGRVCLARLMLSRANLLILDEPTNHLDMVSKEILESALNSYTGTVFYVSHDRYFINRTCTRIMELTPWGLTDCEGDYDYYMEKRDDLINTLRGTAAEDKPSVEAPSAAAVDYAAQKAEKARLRKLENDLKKCEDEIEKTENALARIEEEMNDPAVMIDAGRLMELSEQSAALSEKLDELMETWETLSDKNIS